MIRYVFLAICCILLNSAPVFAEGFVDNGDGTVTDTETGLMWQQATADERTWEAAITYCENLTLAGYTDWRLPNRMELQSLVDYTRYAPSIDNNFFPVDSFPGYYWSSTTLAYRSDCAWLVGFSSGFVTLSHQSDDKGKSDTHHVRAVREGQ